MKIFNNTGGTIAAAGSRSFLITRKNGGGNDKPPMGRGLLATVWEALPFTRSRTVNLYRLRNLINIWRGFWRIAAARIFRVPTVYGALYGQITRANGDVVNLGLISLRVVTNAGVEFLVDAFQNLTELEILKFHGFGTGSTAEAAGQTALVTELTTQYPTDNTRPTGSTTEGAAANIYRTVGSISPDAAVAITEHGLFSQAAAPGGIMLDRSVFAVNNIGIGDTFQVTYDFTIASGS